MKRLCILFLICLMPLAASAQKDWGAISGGIQSDGLWSKDGALYANNYLKLDYVKGRFSAGLQAEYYPNPIPGYDASLKGIGLPGKYVAWQDTLWTVTAGDFYDQFGTGVLFRSWEDRNLGWNNSLGGGRFTFRTRDDMLSAKVLGGWRRNGLWYGSARMAGAEGAFKWNGIELRGSGLLQHDGVTPVWGYSALAGYENGGFTSRAEWVGRGAGNAQTLELGYAAGKFSSTFTARRLQGMTDPVGLNYLPSLSMEQSYALATLNPYTTFGAGEIGGSGDVYYRLGSWRFHVNGCMIYALPSALKNHDVCRMTYRDINIHVEKRWNRYVKTVAFVSIQEQSPSHGERKATEAQNVFVLDGVFRLGRKLALHTCAQYLYSQELTRDWMAGVLELSSTDGWSVHVQDMYNHGSTGEHYYEAGASWSRGEFKVNLSYGHQRAGMVCSGGVCRWQPEYTGALLRLSYNF